MARKYSPKETVNRTLSRRSMRKVRPGKTLPGSEAVWSKEHTVNAINRQGNNPSSIEKTLNKFNNVVSNQSMRKPIRRKHRSEMKPQTNLGSHLYAKMVADNNQPVGESRYNRYTDVGPGHSISGISDNLNQNPHNEKFILKSTVYGTKLMRSTFDKKRK